MKHDSSARESKSNVVTAQTDLPSPTTGESTANREAPRKPGAAELKWEKTTLKNTLDKTPERQKTFTTISGHPIRRL
jgi:hypothetical protein